MDTEDLLLGFLYGTYGIFYSSEGDPPPSPGDPGGNRTGRDLISPTQQFLR